MRLCALPFDRRPGEAPDRHPLERDPFIGSVGARPILSTVDIVRLRRRSCTVRSIHRGLRRLSLGAIAATSSLAIAGCSGASSGQTATTASVVSPRSTPPTVSPPTSTIVPPTTAPTSQASNVPISHEIRSQLVAAAAALNKIPVSEYSGLASGLTYYAIDRTTTTYWAGARLVPVPSPEPAAPTQAQVASQDDGSYYLFSHPEGGSWTAYAVGASGPDSPCQVTPPPQVLEAWGWATGSCRPLNS